MHFTPLATLVPILLGVTVAQDGGTQLLSAEHFDDLVTQSNDSRKVDIDTFLCIHTDECPCKIDHSQIPSALHAVFLTYAKDEMSKYIWYEKEPGGTLVDRYWKGEGCQNVMLFRAGDDIKDPSVRWDKAQDPDLVDWINSFYKVSISFTNNFLDNVLVAKQQWTGQTLEHHDRINVGETANISLTKGNFLLVHALTNNQLVYGVVAGSGPEEVELKPFQPMDTYLEQIDREREHIDSSLTHIYHTAQRYLQEVKQPKMLPFYTKTGYKQMKAPLEVYEHLKDFFKQNYRFRQAQMAHNAHEVPEMSYLSPSHLPLEGDLVEEVVETIAPKLESWCNCSLFYRLSYGINEYYNGSRLPRHIDSATDHVISAIVSINQEIAKSEWPMEIIDHNGTRNNISLQPGDLFFYESATVSHGWPSLFQGSKYAVAYFHFVPKDWRFTMVGEEEHRFDNLGVLALRNNKEGMDYPLWPLDAKPREIPERPERPERPDPNEHEEWREEL